MWRIAPDEFDALLACIRELHAMKDVPALCDWLLGSVLPQLIPSEWYSFNDVDLLNPEKTLAILYPKSDLTFQKYFRRFQELVHQHPLIIRQMQQPDFAVHKISDFLSQEEFHRLELYQEVYRHLGVEHQISATIKLSPDRISAFALSRRHGDYTERDRAMLELLRPHLVVAFNNLALAREQQFSMDTVTLALTECSAATFIVNAQGQILYHTGPGAQWLGLPGLDRLPASILQWLQSPAPRAGHRRMSLPTDAGFVHLRAVPTHHPERQLLVLTLEIKRSPAGIPTKIEVLSQREREVTDWICAGKTNAEIAGILGISPRTVQKHVEHIYEKLGVETRLALAQRLRA